MITLALIAGPSNISYAAEKNALELYELKLEELNTEFKTKYRLQPNSGETYQNMINFYLSMSIDEFESYIRTIHTNMLNGNSTKMPNTPQTTSISSYQQISYYDGANGLTIRANISTNNATKTYVDITDYGRIATHYPYYEPIRGLFTYYFSSDKKIATCIYTCGKYIGSNLTDGVSYSIKCKYNANNIQGDII